MQGAQVPSLVGGLRSYKPSGKKKKKKEKKKAEATQVPIDE